MNTALLLVALAQTSAPLQASVGLGFVGHAERLSIGDAPSTRTLLGPTLSLGVDFTFAHLGPLEVESGTSLGLGLIFSTGHVAVQPAQAIRFVAWPTSWLGFAIGLEGALWLDTADATYSYVAVQAPIELRLGPVALAYAPRLSLPIASERTDVLGGERQQRIATSIHLASFALRVVFDTPQADR